MTVSKEDEGVDTQLPKMKTLGTLQLRHKETQEIILIPTPSNDPNDPLNWFVPPERDLSAVN
jgi:hypothetical protein